MDLTVASPAASPATAPLQRAAQQLQHGIDGLAGGNPDGFEALAEARADIEQVIAGLDHPGRVSILTSSVDAIRAANEVADFTEPVDSWQPDAQLLNGAEVADHAREALRLLSLAS